MTSSFNINRIWTIIQFELLRLFGAKRGLVILSAFACIWFVIYYYVISSAVDIVNSPSFESIIQQVFGKLNLLILLDWNIPQLSMYWLVAVFLLPLFALLFSCDQTCSDRERGTLRFILLRTTRAELLVGRFIGQSVVMIILSSLTLMVSLLIASASGQTLSSGTISISFTVFVQLVIIILPFVASMSLINSFVKSSKMSIVTYILLYILGGVLINVISYLLIDVSLLSYLYPGEQIDRVVGFQGNIVDTAVIPLLQTALYLILAHVVMKRASL